MIQVSQDFAPPFKLIAPYFVIGTVFYVFSILFALGFDPNAVTYFDNAVFGWVHLFLLGFVMMVIFGAMAQLVPVVLEVGHFAVEFFYIIYPLLAIGTILMVMGFVYYPSLLPYGGTVVLTAMMIFIVDVFITLRKVEKLNFVMKSVVLANIFLFLGVIVGIVMALGYAGVIEIDILSLLKAHVYFVVAGYVCITIMGLSMILIPMFGLSHDFSWKPIEWAMGLISTGIMLVFISALSDIAWPAYIGYLLSCLSLTIYFYQIYVLYKTRARKEHDIYAKSLYFSYGSLLFSLLLFVVYMFTGKEPLLNGGAWLLFVGFFGFLITGHLYKIVPFLVWFERFSPYVGKKKVPMLADMIPLKSAYFQFGFSSAGTLIAMIGLIFSSNDIFKAGVSFLFIGSLYLLGSLIFMIRFK